MGRPNKPRQIYTRPFDTVEQAKAIRTSLGTVDPTLDGRWVLQVYSPSRDSWVVWGRPRTREGEALMIRELKGKRWRYRVDLWED